MTKEDKQLLADLLHRMVGESEEPSPDEPQGRPAGFIPEVCLKPFYKATRTPFVELIIYRKHQGRFEYFYQSRRDRSWDGFCAFGGMVRSNFPATPVEIAQKLIDREFKDYELIVETVQIVSAVNWQQHPWCNPYAIVELVEISGEIPQSKGVWLSADNIPKEMVQYHGDYIRQCEYFLHHGALVFTREHPFGI